MAEKPKIYSIDGKLILSEKAALPLNDLAFTRAYCAFESLRTYQRVPFLAEKHIQRLLATSRILRIRHSHSFKNIMQTMKKTLAANPDGEKLVRVFITAGEGAGLITSGKPHLIVMVDEMTPPPPKHMTQGVSLMTYRYIRPTPIAKSTNYTEAVLATRIAKQNNFDEAVFINQKSEITEGTTFNILALRGSTWVMPSECILPGITLRTMLGFLVKREQKIARRNIKLSEISKFDALFITSSNREILPVRKVDNIPVKVIASAGPSLPLYDLYRKHVESYTMKNKSKWA